MNLRNSCSVAVAFVLVHSFTYASACSCKGLPRTVKDSIDLAERSDIVLLGQLEEANIRLWASNDEERPEFLFKFSVIEWIKGENHEREVEIEVTHTDCLSGLHPKNLFLIFASTDQVTGRPTAHACRLYVYERTDYDEALENEALRERIAPLLDIIRSRTW